jgi:CBS-domain-containing membrane protein
MKKFKAFLGIQKNGVAQKEILIAAMGGFLSIFFILHITNYFASGLAGVLIAASMGSSAVLLFAVPQGELSQPWPLIGGHFFSACIGVLLYKLVPDIYLAAALVVGLSIAAMYYARCIHPPGGATALAIVIGGTDIATLGFNYVLTPVLLNSMVMVLLAVLLNYPFAWRRYPAVWLVRADALAGEKSQETNVDERANWK